MSGEILGSLVPRQSEWPKPSRVACRLCPVPINTNCDGERATVVRVGDASYFVHRSCLEKWQKENETFAMWFEARVGAVFEEKNLHSAWTAGALAESARLREKVEAMLRDAQAPMVGTVTDHTKSMGRIEAIEEVLALLAEPGEAP